MNYGFTERVRKALARAREEAFRLNHDYLGDGHILLGLLKEPEGRAVSVLSGLGVDALEALQRVEGSLSAGTSTISAGELPYTEGGKKVLEGAMR